AVPLRQAGSLCGLGGRVCDRSARTADETLPSRLVPRDGPVPLADALSRCHRSRRSSRRRADNSGTCDLWPAWLPLPRISLPGALLDKEGRPIGVRSGVPGRMPPPVSRELLCRALARAASGPLPRARTPHVDRGWTAPA